MSEQVAILKLFEELKNDINSINVDAKNNMQQIRDTNSDIMNQLHALSGSIQLISQELNTQKADNKERFERVHDRIDKEQELNKEVRDSVNEIAPQVRHITKVFDWATKSIVVTIIAGVMWATSQFLNK